MPVCMCFSPHEYERTLCVCSMLVQGGGGVGKTFLVQCIVKHLRALATEQGLGPDKFVQVAAPTGTAALNVKGRTLHGLVSIPVMSGFQPLQGASLMNMQLKMEGLRYLLVDERSMVGRRMLGRVDSRMKQAFANELLLGGVSVVFLGENAVMLWAA